MEAFTNKMVEVYDSVGTKVTEHLTDSSGNWSFVLPIGVYSIKVLSLTNYTMNNAGSSVADSVAGNNALTADGATGIDLTATAGANVTLVFDQVAPT